MKKKIKRKYTRLAIGVLLAGLIVWTLWGNRALEVNTYTVSSEKLPQSFSGFRIAQISDLHNAEFGADNEKLLTMLRETDPDIIVLTGDLVDSYHTDLQIALDFAGEAVKIAPCYYVTGNHEARITEYPMLKS